MEIVISYSEALLHHPEFVKKWLDYAIQLGGQLGIKMDESKIVWSYTFSVKDVSEYSLNEEMCVGDDGGEAPAKTTSEEIANNIIGNIYDIKINAIFAAEFSTTVKTESLQSIPGLFVTKCMSAIIEGVNKNGDWMTKFYTLTPQEKERAELNLLNELFFDVRDTVVSEKVIEYNLNDILDKISAVGMVGLSDGERRFLDEHSKQ